MRGLGQKSIEEKHPEVWGKVQITDSGRRVQSKSNTSRELSVGKGLSRILHCPIWWLLSHMWLFKLKLITFH